MSQNLFSSDVELGKFLCSIDIIPFALRAISETYSNYQLHTSLSPGIKVLAFTCSSDYTTRFLNGNFDLVSSENHEVIDFISTNVNPPFAINKAAVDLFESLPEDLKELGKKHIDSPLVITGQGLGGYRAILFALWLHHIKDVEESNNFWDSKRPFCITFGSPLVGDEALQLIISKYPQWKSCFLNVVAMMDPVASFFSSNSLYKPFGTFLFGMESGGHTAFEDQDSILAVLDAMASNAGNKEMYEYGNLLISIRRKILCRGVSNSSGFNLNSLKSGITLQFKEVGVLDKISNDLIGRLEEKQSKMIKGKKNVYEPTKKLNDLKIRMIRLEIYINTSRPKGGYYDIYKNSEGKDDTMIKSKIITVKRMLEQYWDWFIEETERKPQKEDAKMRTRWLLNGHNYRRMFEPLDIAEFYTKPGNRNYMDKRSSHYIKIEKLSNKVLKPSFGNKKAALLTEDSCFWAHVEEALISLSDLEVEGSSHNVDDNKQKLEHFEAYVMSGIKNYSVSKDIFLTGSSFMKWWRAYKTYKGSLYTSEFVQYMNNESYKLYQ